MTTRERRAWNALTDHPRSEAHVIIAESPPPPGMVDLAACGVVAKFVSGERWRHLDHRPRRECSRCRKARLALGEG